MHGTTVVITGGNAGIGKETAVALAALGAHVVLAVRNPARGAAARDEIATRVPDAAVDVLTLDLASLDSIAEFAAALPGVTDRLDVLINNAGVVMRERRTTDDGFEMTFGVNHLGHFALTEALRPLLRRSAPARIVVVSSGAHRAARRGLDFDDLQFEHHRYSMWQAYCRSKLANLLHTRELARRLDGTGVTANAVHPGAVGTRFAQDGDTGRLGHLVMALGKPFMLTPQKGARTSVHVATAPELATISGRYFEKSAAATPSRWALDDAAAARLWDLSEALLARR